MLSTAEPIELVLRQLLQCLPFMEAQMADMDHVLAAKGLPKDLQVVPPWASLYEMTFVQHVLCVAQVVGASAQLTGLTQSPEPNLAILRAAEQEATSDDDVPVSSALSLPLVLGAVLSMMANMRAIGVHGVPLNKLLAIGATGDDSALLKAIRIDPTIISGETLSVRLARAFAVRDTKFFQATIGAIREGSMKIAGSSSQKERHPKLKYCLSIMEDLGQLDALSEHAAYELFAVQLGVYPQEGQSRDAARSLWRLIARWKRFARHDSGHVMSS